MDTVSSKETLVNQTLRSRLLRQVSSPRRRLLRLVSRLQDRWRGSRLKLTSTVWSTRLCSMTHRISLIKWNSRHKHLTLLPMINSRSLLTVLLTVLRKLFRAMNWSMCSKMISKWLEMRRQHLQQRLALSTSYPEPSLNMTTARISVCLVLSSIQPSLSW